MPQPPNASKAGSCLPGWRGPVYPLSRLLLLLQGYLRCRVCSPKTLVGLAREPESFLSIHPQPLLILGTLRSCQAASCLGCPFLCTEHVSCSIFSWSSYLPCELHHLPPFFAQTRISALHRVPVQPVPFGAQAPDSNAMLRALLCGCSWGDKERIVMTPLCCRALVSYSFFFYCAKICITSILPFL